MPNSEQSGHVNLSAPGQEPDGVAEWASSALRPDVEFDIAQDSDGPAPTREQFELGLSLQERITDLEGATESAVIPAGLQSGVIGYYKIDSGGYTVVLGAGQPEDEWRSRILADLPANSADELTFEWSRHPTGEYVSAWEELNSVDWSNLTETAVAYALDPRDHTIALSVHSSLRPDAIELLDSISPVVKIEVSDSQLSRAAGGRFSHS